MFTLLGIGRCAEPPDWSQPPMARQHFMRSDYKSTYEAGGAAALNRLLSERYTDPEVLVREMQRMEKSGLWEIAWDDEGPDSRVVRRLDVPAA